MVYLVERFEIDSGLVFLIGQEFPNLKLLFQSGILGFD